MTNQLVAEAAALPEEWRSVPDWPDYEASNKGRIRLAVDRPNGRWHHGGSAHRRGFVLRLRLRRRRGDNDVPYYVVNLNRRGKQIERRVNRLVCQTFHGPAPTDKHHAAHKNCDSLDNIETNLYWATPLENVADSVRSGRTSSGERHTPSKLKIPQIIEIRARKKAGRSRRLIATDFGISASTVGQIVRGETWRQIL